MKVFWRMIIKGNHHCTAFFSGYSVIWKLWRKRVPQLARAHPCPTTCSSGRDAFSDPPTPHSKMGHSSSSFSSARSTPSIPHRSGHYINLFVFEIREWFVWRTNQWSQWLYFYILYLPAAVLSWSSRHGFLFWQIALQKPITSNYVASGSIVIIDTVAVASGVPCCLQRSQDT